MEKQILQQYIEGKLSQPEKEELAKWLDADQANMQEYLLLRAIYDTTLWNDQKIEEEQTIVIPAKRTRLIREFLKIAALFIFALGCSYFFLHKAEVPVEPEIVMQTLYVPEGQRAELLLADGTKVWLNAKTSFSFPTRFTNGERRVKLDGEAYFDVRKEESQHFIVSTQKHQVKVLGTEFNIKAYRQNNYFETSLLQGSVEVTSDDTNQKVTLVPHTYVFEKNGKLTLAPLQNKDQFLWREGIIAFEAEKVRDIFSKLELYFDVKMEVRNTRILDYPYTGKFRTKDGVEHVLKVLQLRHKFTYTKDNETNTIVIR